MKKIFLILFLLTSLLICTNAQSLKSFNSEKLISSTGEIYMSPVWSPDGSMIAFTGEGYTGINIINLDDKSIKHITDEKAAGFKMKWSHDSKLILTRVARYEGIRRYNAVKTFNVVTGESTTHTDYRTMMPGLPQWSNAGDKIFMYGSGELEIFDSEVKANKTNGSSILVYVKDDKIAVENIQTKDLKVYEPVKGERVLNLEVSPDGSKVTFEIIGGDMYVMNVDGTGLINLGRGYRPAWSPDSRHIVYMITEDDGHQILSSDLYSIKIDGTEKTNLTNTSNILEMNPSWSPDGNFIAYDVPEEGAIYIMKLEN